MARRYALLAGVIAVVLGPVVAHAHPHAWIDLRSTVVLDDQGRVRALELDWLFDDFYTAYIAEQYTKDEGSPTSFLEELANTNLTQLAEYGYFTDARLDGERLEAGPVEHFETGLRGQRLWLRFELPLAKPVDPRQGRFTYAVYDPTYYIEILHLEDEPIAFRPASDDQCSARIEPANPSLEAVGLAAALDSTESGGDSLGQLFAETVVLDCR